MIQTKEDLRHYLKEDAWRNGFGGSFLSYLYQLLRGNENAFVLHYLRSLRYCEYHHNQKSLFHKLPYYYYAFKTMRLSSKYHIRIPLNVTGYGLRIMHLSGGGGIIER